MKDLRFYEFTGVLAPGAVLLFGLMLLFKGVRQALSGDGMELGELGLFLVLAYVAGQLLQGLGNLLEQVYWGRWGGMPTEWVQENKALRCRKQLLSSQQHDLLGAKVVDHLGLQPESSLAAYVPWERIVRQVSAAVEQGAAGEKVQVFNGHYGLHRGIATAFIALLVFALASGHTDWRILVGLALGTLIAGYRMHRFAVHYAKRLFVEFLQLPVPVDAGCDGGAAKG